jgi:hypothetical protein
VTEMAAQDNDRARNSADSFDDFLRNLKSQESAVRDDAIRKTKEDGTANYNDWASHFEMLKSQFKRTYDLFVNINLQVPNWVCERQEVPKTHIPFQDPNDWVYGSVLTNRYEGYRFKAELSRYDAYLEEKDKSLTVETGFIGSEKDLLPVNKDFNHYPELSGIGLLNPAFITISKTAPLIKKLEEAKIGFTLERDGIKFERSVGLGFLYEHNLDEVCKELFMLMNGPIEEDYGVDKSGLYIPGREKKFVEARMGIISVPEGDEPRRGIIIPAGDYRIRRTNFQRGVDDNTIAHADDPQWRNG